MRCKASCSDPPSRPHTFLQLAIRCLCQLFLGRRSTVLDAVPDFIALFTLHSSPDMSGRPFCSVPTDTSTEASPSMPGIVLVPSSSFRRAIVGRARNINSEVNSLRPLVHLLLNCITSIKPDSLSKPTLVRRRIAVCSDAAGVLLYLAGNSTAGSRVITSYGMATLIKVQVNTWFINGTGVS